MDVSEMFSESFILPSRAYLLYDSRLIKSRHFLSRTSLSSATVGMVSSESAGSVKLPARRIICSFC